MPPQKTAVFAARASLWFLLALTTFMQNGDSLSRRSKDLPVLASNNTRFVPLGIEQRPKRSKELLLFMSITSSPHHSHLRHAARFTWLLPCIASPHCDYKFFIDKTISSADTMIMNEKETYDDMVFRNSCKLMDRHAEFINYGNSPPRDENLKVKFNNTLIDAPDYLWRRMYKVDWKVCFMQYARDNNRMAKYHVFTEDDSFVCTENLLHQCVYLDNKTKELGSTPSFRTGTSMFDGFDDSSTFMTRDVALAFADHYGEEGFNCSAVVDHVNSAAWNGSMWMSWGNSWMKVRCNWAATMKEHLHMSVMKPNADCMAATSLTVHKNHTVLAFPCAEHNIIMHHGTAGEVLLRENSAHIRHTCEHMLLIDKVKDAKVMYDLWNTASVEHTFHDFSAVFLHEKEEGWLKTLQQLARDDNECRSEMGNTLDPTAKDCIFESRRLRRRRLVQVNKQNQISLFGSSSNNSEPPLQQPRLADIDSIGNNSAMFQMFYSGLIMKLLENKP